MFTICMTVAMLQPMMAAAVLVRQTSCSAPEIDPSMCSNGDIFMLGDRLQLGVHRCGSFGGAVAPSEAVKTGRLGAAADFDENGFDTYSYCDGDNYMYYYGTVPFDVCPMYSGDFITPGNAIEGWVVQWKASGQSIKRQMMFGLMDTMDHFSLRRFQLTPSTTSHSALWIGSFGPIEVVAVTTAGLGNLYFTTHVKIRNIGPTMLTDLYYERTVDPDNEFEAYWSTYATRNYAKYQPRAQTRGLARAGDRYTSATHPETALVVARGVEKADFYLGLGTVDANARVAHNSLRVNPDDQFNDNRWLDYGGSSTSNDDVTRMHIMDENVHVVFSYDSLAPGEIVQLQFVYVLAVSHEEDALSSLSQLTIVQPVHVVGGHSAAVVVRCGADMTLLKLAVFGTKPSVSSFPSWFPLASSGGCTTGQYVTTIFDASAFSDGSVQIQATGSITGVAVGNAETNVGAFVCNAGPIVIFEGDSGQPFLFVTSRSTIVALDMQSFGNDFPESVSFYRDVQLADQVKTLLLGSSAVAPYSVAVAVMDLPPGLPVYVRAEAFYGPGRCIAAVTLTGIVTVENQAPTDISLSSSYVFENAATGTIIGLLFVTDPDHSTAVRYTLLDDAAGVLELRNDSLVVRGPIDYESTRSLPCRVLVDDGGSENCCFERSFLITVIDVNEAPTLILPLILNISEDTLPGTLIATFNAIDPDEGQAVTYAFVTSAAAFTLDAESGQLKTAGGLDFESAPVYILSLRAMDSGSPAMFLSSSIVINIINANEAPYGFHISCASPTCIVPENSPIGFVVGLFGAEDADFSDVLSFALTGSAGGLFTVDSSSGQLKVAAGIDFESIGSEVSITGRVTDMGGLSATLTVLLRISNVAEPPYAEDIECFVNENRLIGETVTAVAGGATACTMGMVRSEGTEVEFAISDPTAPFALHSCSGVFSISAAVDYEVQRVYRISIIISDDGGMYMATAVINIVDVNEPPVLFPLRSVTVDENSPVGTAVGMPLASLVMDPDCNGPLPHVYCGPLHFSITGGSGAMYFNFLSDTEGQLAVLVAVLNFEVIDSYTLVIRVSDREGMFAEALLRVDVSDVNEMPRLTHSGSMFAILPEDAPVGAVVGGAIFATDDDAGQTLSVSVICGNDAGGFALEKMYNATLGHYYQLVVNQTAVLNFESVPLFHLVLAVEDNGFPILSYNQTYKIELSDVNESPMLVSPIVFSVRENTTRLFTVGSPLNMFWFDPDKDDTAEFMIVDYGDDDYQSFGIDRYSGSVTLHYYRLNYEYKKTYCYVVKVVDKGGLMAFSNLTIKVLDVPEAPVFDSLFSVEIGENIPRGDEVTLSISNQQFVFSATDNDNDPLDFVVLAVDGAQHAAHMFYTARIGASYSSVVVFANCTLNFELAPTHNFTISVSDGYFTTTAAVLVKVLDANDAPTIMPQITCYVSADIAIGSHVCTIIGTDEDTAAGTVWGQLNYSFRDAQSGYEIVTINNIGVIIYVSASLNISSENTFTVIVTDGGGLTVQTTVVVIALPPHPAPRCSSEPIRFSLLENCTAGDLVGYILSSHNSTDFVSSSHGELNVSLVAGNDFGSFYLNESSGQLIAMGCGLSIDYERNRKFELTILATEVSVYPLSVSCVAHVDIVDVNEPTIFVDQEISTDENIRPGALSVGGEAAARVRVFDSDPADQHGAFTLTCVECGDNPISINSTTGELFLKLGHRLNHERLSRYEYYCSWDSRGVSAGASIIVIVLDVYESPVVLPSHFEVFESDETTVVGSIAVMDPDFDRLLGPAAICGARCGLRYILDSGDPNMGQFAVDSRTGVISLGSSDFENIAFYRLVVRAVDESGLYSTGVVIVSVLDRSDCAATALIGLDRAAVKNASTAGGTMLIVYGSNFGPTAKRASEGAALLSVTAWLQSSSVSSLSSHLYPVDCRVNKTASYGNTKLACIIPPGVGQNLGLVLYISASYSGNVTFCSTSLSVGRMSYNGPSISSIKGADFLLTSGGSVIEITGSNFGLSAKSFIQVIYANDFVSRTVICEVVVDHTKLRCLSAPGIGGSLSWAVLVGGQRSTTITAGTYGPPAISNVSNSFLSTAGGDFFEIIGYNFGDVKGNIEVNYGFRTALEFKATSCKLVLPHVVLSCRAGPGIGRNLFVSIIIGGLSSTVFQSLGLSYRVPEVFAVTGPGTMFASTAGGDIVHIRGANFGPKDVDPDEIIVNYGPISDPSRYTALSCRVISNDVLIECTTVPGTGTGLVWSVVVAGQRSAIAPVKTYYAAPVVLSYAGEGAVAARSEGNDTVVIMGRNFGPSIFMVQEISYQSFNKTKFTVTESCKMTQPHVSIQCRTAPGAGAHLTWFVKVDGQVSVAPTTAYAPPAIRFISGSRTLNASVQGGDVMQIYGTNFGPSIIQSLIGVSFLDRVTYGKSGTEYTANDCTVVSSGLIECVTVAGVGRDMIFKVAVGGQESLVSMVSFSYAFPVLFSVSPNAASTDGSTTVIVSGSNLAAFSGPILYFSGGQLDILFISDSEFQFTVPELIYPDSAAGLVFMDVGGQASNTLTLLYRMPTIRAVSSVVGINGTLLLIITGDSFSMHPLVEVNDDSLQMKSLLSCDFANHHTINCLTTSKKGTVAILVGNQCSESSSFEFGPPVVLSSYLSVGASARTEGYQPDNPAILTVTGQNFGEKPQVSIESKDGVISVCLFLSHRLISALSVEWKAIVASTLRADLSKEVEQINCQLPAGQGANNSIRVLRGSAMSMGCGCRGCNDGPCFSYLPPIITAISPRTGPTRGNYEVVLSGHNFGASQIVFVGGVPWLVEQNRSSHTRLVLRAQAGDGTSLSLEVFVSGQTSANSSNFFSYHPPVIITSMANLTIGTEGSKSPIILRGLNFGVSGPVVLVSGRVVKVVSFSDNTIAFMFPPGQGRHIEVAVFVHGQMTYANELFAYLPPMITSVFPCISDSAGGRAQNVTTVIDGFNFGSIDGDWELHIGTFSVNSVDIVSFTSNTIVFYAPEGFGRSLIVSLAVSGQHNDGLVFTYMYRVPEVIDVIYPSELDTSGGDVIIFRGTSLGGGIVVIMLEDNNNSSESMRVAKMPLATCSVLTHTHSEVTCSTPPGAGGDIKASFYLEGRLVVTVPLKYGMPKISHFYLSKGGDAAGQETIKIFGSNFGSFRTAVDVIISGISCLDSVWLADDPMLNYRPYLQCKTPAIPVGIQNVTVHVAFQHSMSPVALKVNCKTGSFGRLGELCSHCGEPENTGLVCSEDNMAEPHSYQGFYLQQIVVPSSTCSDESQTLRATCPAAQACLPRDACTGYNTCAPAYEGERCGECAEGYYKINGDCQSCPITPWFTPVTLLSGLIISFVIFRYLQKQGASMSILFISVDYFQVISVFASANIAWPSSMVWLFNLSSAANMNIDTVAAECYLNADISYRDKWYIINSAPVFLFLFSTCCFAAFLLTQQRQTWARLLEEAIGKYVVVFYFAYLMLSRNSLAVFNCQQTDPSDGHHYMVDVGTTRGQCYTEGSMQQELKPWAVMSIVIYCLGFPIVVAHMMWHYRDIAITDQLMKAARIKAPESTNAGRQMFRAVFRRLYTHFKPNRFYWSLLLLLKKILLSLVALIFRNNTVFLLALYLLVLFVAYYAQVRFSPYMPVSAYESVVQNDAIISELNKEEMIKDAASASKKMKKIALLGRDGSLVSSPIPVAEFFTDYNTVESYLLMSTVMIAISGLMFESDQLTNRQQNLLAAAMVLLITVSMFFLLYIVLMEVCSVLFPRAQLWCTFWADVRDPSKSRNVVNTIDYDIELEDCNVRCPQSDFLTKDNKLLYLQMQLETNILIMEKQKQDIDRLKKGEYAKRAQGAFWRGEMSSIKQSRMKKKVSSSVFDQINPMINSNVIIDQ